MITRILIIIINDKKARDLSRFASGGSGSRELNMRLVPQIDN